MNLREDCARNIVLIGMPGAGKSTVGVLLAKRLGYHFVDSDLLLQAKAESRLQEIIRTHGLAVFRELEEKILSGLRGDRTVFATGGSAVYSAGAMQHLRSLGKIVFIDTPVDVLEARVRDMDARGVVVDPGQSYADLFRHRRPLYRQHADVVIASGQQSAEDIAGQIETQICGQAPLDSMEIR